uniref:Uncharacterized protein n=1 Tax=Branchiostoma floridae TaxID=7739 RepID=C3ZXW2_BRAFL|eukprot:XP_002586611.1 hypothetical protein BRAFLDRAFT_106122 [Branchiostoma floridae]
MSIAIAFPRGNRRQPFKARNVPWEYMTVIRGNNLRPYTGRAEDGDRLLNRMYARSSKMVYIRKRHQDDEPPEPENPHEQVQDIEIVISEDEEEVREIPDEEGDVPADKGYLQVAAEATCDFDRDDKCCYWIKERPGRSPPRGGGAASASRSGQDGRRLGGAERPLHPGAVQEGRRLGCGGVVGGRAGLASTRGGASSAPRTGGAKEPGTGPGEDGIMLRYPYPGTDDQDRVVEVSLTVMVQTAEADKFQLEYVSTWSSEGGRFLKDCRKGEIVTWDRCSTRERLTLARSASMSDVYHTTCHWSNADSMERYVEMVVQGATWTKFENGDKTTKDLLVTCAKDLCPAVKYEAYRRREGEHRLLRNFLSLLMLPHEHVRPTFEALCEEAANANDARLDRLTTYIRTYWVESTVWEVLYQGKTDACQVRFNVGCLPHDVPLVKRRQYGAELQEDEDSEDSLADFSHDSVEPVEELFSIHAFLQSGDDIKQVRMKLPVRMANKRRQELRPQDYAVLQSGEAAPLRLFLQGGHQIRRAQTPCLRHRSEAKAAIAGEDMEAYRRREGEHRLLRNFLSLLMLPHEHVRPTFEALCEEAANANDARLDRLTTYIRTYWVESTVWEVIIEDTDSEEAVPDTILEEVADTILEESLNLLKKQQTPRSNTTLPHARIPWKRTQTWTGVRCLQHYYEDLRMDVASILYCLVIGFFIWIGLVGGTVIMIRAMDFNQAIKAACATATVIFISTAIVLFEALSLVNEHIRQDMLAAKKLNMSVATGTMDGAAYFAGLVVNFVISAAVFAVTRQVDLYPALFCNMLATILVYTCLQIQTAPDGAAYFAGLVVNFVMSAAVFAVTRQMDLYPALFCNMMATILVYACLQTSPDV